MLIEFLIVASSVYIVGMAGIYLNRKNIILVLMSVELMLLAVNFQLIIFSSFSGDRFGQIFALFILTVAAAESAIGLAILVVYYRIRGSVSMELIRLLKG